MPELSMHALREWAGHDVELRSVTENEQTTIQASGRTFGGRVARNLKIGVLNEDRSAKRAQYQGAKDAVLAALKREYGEAIGLKAFRAAVGRAQAGGGWESSVDHPLTGRQIEKMLSVADRESARKAPAAQLLEVEPRLVRLQAVEGPKGRMKAGEALDAVLGSLAHEIAAWHEAGGAGPRVWLLEAGYEGSPDGAQIGIRLDRAEDGMVQVVGRDGEPAEVALDELPRWLVEKHLGGPVRSLALLRADAWSLGDWVGEARNLPPDLRGLEVRAMASRELGEGNPGRLVARRIEDDVRQWTESMSGRLIVSDELYALDVEPPPDQIGRLARLAIRVSGDWSHPRFGHQPNPEVMVEVCDSGGEITAMRLAELEGWLNRRLAGERGTLRLGKETPCPRLGPYFAAIARAEQGAIDRAATDDVNRLRERMEHIESIAKSSVDRAGAELAILELEALRQRDPSEDARLAQQQWGDSLQDGAAGRRQRWRDQPEVLQLFAEVEDAIDQEIAAQMARLEAVLQELPPQAERRVRVRRNAPPENPPRGILKQEGGAKGGQRISIGAPPPRLEPIRGEAGWRLPLRTAVPAKDLEYARRAELGAITRKLSAGLGADKAGIAGEGVSAALVRRAGMAPLRILVRGELVPPGTDGGLDGEALLERLSGLAGDPDDRAGLTRFLEDSVFHEIYQDTLKRLGLEDDERYEVAIDVVATDDGYAVTFRAPLPGPLDYRVDKGSVGPEGRIENPVLAMTIGVSAREVTEQAPLPSVQLRILEGG